MLGHESRPEWLQLKAIAAKEINWINVRGVARCVGGSWFRYLYSGFHSALLPLHSFVKKNSTGRQQGQRSGGKTSLNSSAAAATAVWTYVFMCGCVFAVGRAAGGCILIANNRVDKARVYRIRDVCVRLHRKSIQIRMDTVEPAGLPWQCSLLNR